VKIPEENETESDLVYPVQEVDNTLTPEERKEFEAEKKEIEENKTKARLAAIARKIRDEDEMEAILKKEEQWKEKRKKKVVKVVKALKFNMPAGLENQGMDDEESDGGEDEIAVCILCGQPGEDLQYCGGLSCERAIHPKCATAPLDSTQRWFCDDCDGVQFCVICGKSGGEFVNCTGIGCQRSAHCTCAGLSTVTDKWVCYGCES